MNVERMLTDIGVLACGGIITVSVAYTLIKSDLKGYLSKSAAKNKDLEKTTLLPLRLQAHERLVVFIDRITPANLFLRLHQPGISLSSLQSALLNEVRSEYQHNIAQQLYVSAATWEVVSKLKEDTLAMVNSAVKALPEEALGVDLSRMVLQHMAGMEQNPYDLTLVMIRKEIHQLF